MDCQRSKPNRVLKSRPSIYLASYYPYAVCRVQHHHLSNPSSLLHIMWSKYDSFYFAISASSRLGVTLATMSSPRNAQRYSLAHLESISLFCNLFTNQSHGSKRTCSSCVSSPMYLSLAVVRVNDIF